MPPAVLPDLRRRILATHAHKADLALLQPALAVTLSIGLAAAGGVLTQDNLLAVADSRLYAAKGGGRNRVTAA